MAGKYTVAIIPARNEAERIEPVVRKALEYAGAVVVVDDGSDDDTSAVARNAGAAVVRHAINLGKGAAMKTGCLAAERMGAEVMVLLDADGQHDPADIPELTGPIEKGGADIVFGARTIEAGERMPLLARFGNRFISFAVKVLFGIALRDTQSGFRAFSADVLGKIWWTSTGYPVETEMITLAGRHGLRFEERDIHTRYPEKYKGTTAFDGISILFNLIVWRLS